MKVIFLLVTVFVCVNSELIHHQLMNLIISRPTKDAFKLWHYQSQKTYDINSEIGLQKFSVFKDNVSYINYKNSEVTEYKLGLGPFSDLTFEEFSQTYLISSSVNQDMKKKQKDVSSRVESQSEKPNKVVNNYISFDELADEDDDDEKSFKRMLPVQYDKDKWGRDIIKSKDYRNLLFPVKDQGQCGSCWAFATIGAVEARLAQQFGADSGFNLSEQHLLECDKLSDGCNGGFFDNAMDYLIRVGARNGYDYVYTAKDGNCKENIYDSFVKVGSSLFCDNDYQYDPWSCNFKKQVDYLNIAPFAAAVHAGRSFVHYQQGQWYPDVCVQINHAVLAIYLEYYEGVPDNQTSERIPKSKFRIRNSWGQYWGENGQADLISYIDDTSTLSACGLGEYAYLANNVTLT